MVSWVKCHREVKGHKHRTVFTRCEAMKGIYNLDKSDQTVVGKKQWKGSGSQPMQVIRSSGRGQREQETGWG